MSEQAAGPTRRTLVRGAAWSVPVVAIATAAPAFAASPCSDLYNYRLVWGTTPYSKGTATATSTTSSATIPAPAGAVSSLAVSFTAARVGTTTLATTNLDLVAGSSNTGGLGQQAIAMRNATTALTRDLGRQEMTITFGRPVRNLVLTITDIDIDLTYNDQVDLSVVPTSVKRPATVVGDGSPTGSTATTGPFRNTTAGNLLPESGAGNVELTYAGPLSSVTIRYWNSGLAGQQAIYITDLKMDALGCG